MSTRTLLSHLSQALALCALGVAALLMPASAADKTPFGGTVRDAVGVNIHFTHPLPGEMAMIHHLGIGAIRMDIAWGDIEKQKGVYDFSDYDVLMSNLEKYHIRPLLILDYGNPLYFNNGSPDDPTWRADFTRWAVATVTHFAGHHVLWEMWNEPNYAQGDWYIHLALATGIALRQADPEETYIGPAEGGTDPAFLERAFKDGLLYYWRAVSIHPYRTSNPETMDYGAIKGLIAEYEPAGADVPVLSGEWGYSVIPAGQTYSFVTSDAEQASYFDREMLWNMMQGIPLSIWYDWRNDYEQPGATEANFGLVHFPYQAGQADVFQPKPSYYAASFFLQTLGDYTFDRALPIPGVADGYCAAFTKGHSHRYTAWITAAAPESAVLPVPAGSYTVYDILGKFEETLTANAAGLPLTLTGDTQFVVPN